MNPVLLTSEKDNVVTCLRAIAKGEELTLDGKTYVSKADIPQFHKMAVGEIKKNEHVTKYGQPIGVATQDISVGDHVHIHNVESSRGRGDKH